MPKKLVFKWNVHLDFNQNLEIEYVKGKINFNKGFGFKEKIIKPTTEDWVEFWLKLDEIGIWEWNNNYDNLLVLDGYSWRLDIISGTKTIKSGGSNDYPENFKTFLEVIETLIKNGIGIIN